MKKGDKGPEQLCCSCQWRREDSPLYFYRAAHSYNAPASPDAAGDASDQRLLLTDQYCAYRETIEYFFTQRRLDNIRRHPLCAKEGLDIALAQDTFCMISNLGCLCSHR